MRKFLLILGCFLSLSLLGTSTAGNPPDFQSLYDSYAAAVRDMNVDAYMSYFAEGFRLATPDGRDLSKGELAESQRSFAKTLRVNAFDVTVESITPLATGEFDVLVLQEFDRDQKTPGASLNLRSSAVRHEIWGNTESGWKILRIENVLSGQPVRRVRHWL